MKNTARRPMLKHLIFSITGVLGIKQIAKALVIHDTGQSVSKTIDPVLPPLYSGFKKAGNLLFISGKGSDLKGDIREQTLHVLSQLDTELQKAGSSMEKVVKVNVYLQDINDYQQMNEVYRGRFGVAPPARTTIAAKGGIPNNSFIEIDCIASV